MLSSTIVNALSNAKKYPYILRVGVFGSHARNEATATSDLDIMIDYNENSDGIDVLDQMGGLMEDIEETITGKIDYMTWYGLMQSKDLYGFRDEIMKEIIWVYES